MPKSKNTNVKKSSSKTTKKINKDVIESRFETSKKTETNKNYTVKLDDSNNYILKMVNIHKSFLNGAIKANIGINLFVKPNTVHAIIGENGAGKSTLMSILFGMYEPDVGEVWINGEKVNFKSSKDASAYKIGMVHQHFKLVDNFTVLENVILGSESSNKIGFLNKSKDKKKIVELIKKYNFNLDVNQKISQLTVGQQQKVEILKVLFRNSNIIIFDEPTAVLSDKEIEQFLDIVNQFKKDGKTIIIISHKLHEIKAVASEATIIRKGAYVETIDVTKTSVEKMAELMVGRKVVTSVNKLGCERKDVVLEVNNLDLSYTPFAKQKAVFKKITNWFKMLIWFIKKIFIKDMNETNPYKNSDASNSNKKSSISFKIHAGEIYAIAGVEGNGQSDIAEFVSGLKKANPKSLMYMGNEIYFDTKNIDQSNPKSNKIKINLNKKTDISQWNVKQRINAGISHVPEDRHKYGLDLEANVRLNTVENIITKKQKIIVNQNIEKYVFCQSYNFTTGGFLTEYKGGWIRKWIVN
ncbi:MAG: ATP-binding cassette domain-containing protein, partial [Malacoplasma sp.]|nr:ATP-binding cassette domain-containing protein [Malacoplasma sp.]